jgi:hypothetical protein
MREPHVEGVATHDDAEPCIGVREGAGEACDRGMCGPGIEPRNHAAQGADAVNVGGNATRREPERKVTVGTVRKSTEIVPARCIRTKVQTCGRENPSRSVSFRRAVQSRGNLTATEWPIIGPYLGPRSSQYPGRRLA